VLSAFSHSDSSSCIGASLQASLPGRVIVVGMTWHASCVQVLDEETEGKAIITTGVGQHQMWAAQWYQYNKPRHWVSSGGLGSMGFGLPSALGAAAAFDGARLECSMFRIGSTYLALIVCPGLTSCSVQVSKGGITATHASIHTQAVAAVAAARCGLLQKSICTAALQARMADRRRSSLTLTATAPSS
jgi:hypothetical protein